MSVPSLQNLICEVPKIDRGLSFSPDVLGREVIYESPHWSAVRVGGVLFGIHSKSEGLNSNGYMPCLVIKKFDDYIGNVELTAPYHVPAGTTRKVIDPDGNQVQLLVITPDF